MEIRKETHILLLLLVISLFVLAYSFTVSVPQQVVTVHAAGISPATGFAWSSNIGWISFNCSNVAGSCATSDYKVDYDSDSGLINGYAWSSNLGWISFQPGDVAGCPSGACQAQISGAELHGWAKVLSNNEFISLNCADLALCGTSNYKTTYDTVTGAVGGYAYGSNVVGWVSFSCIDTGSCGSSGYNVNIPVAAPTTCTDASADNGPLVIPPLGGPLPCTYTTPPPPPPASSSTIDGGEVVPR